jgi:outer membrane protein TolC
MIQRYHGIRGWNVPPPILVFILLLSVNALAFAQETAQSLEKRRLSPDEAVSLAIRNNLSLESSRVSSSTKKRKADTAWNVFIPTVDVGAVLNGSNVRSTSSGVAAVAPIPGLSPIPGLDVYGMVPYSVDVPQWRFILPSVSASLNLSAALFEGMRTLKLDYESGLISYEKAKSQLERDVRKNYYNMLLLQENIGLLRENLVAAERRVEMARANYRAGLAPELTLLQAQVAAENMRPQIDQAENGFKLSKAQFAMNLGLPYNTEFELVPWGGNEVFIPLDVQELIAQASRDKPDIQELKQNILLLESRRKATFWQLYTPTLTLSWNMNPMLWDDVNGLVNGPDNWWKGQSGGLTISLMFRLNNLLPFGSQNQGLKDLDDSLQSLRIGLAQAVQGTELEIYSTILNLEKARATVEAQKLTVDLAERTYRLTEAAYRAGLQDFLEVQNAGLELQKAKIGVLEQNYTYLQGLIDLEYAMGVPFGTLSSQGNPSGGTE